MGLFEQLSYGTLLLGGCALVHVSVLAFGIPLLVNVGSRSKLRTSILFIPTLTLVGFGLIVFAHTLQIWLWAAWFLQSGALMDIETAVYFSLVTYTTLGYGDIVLDEGIRIFAAFSAVAGLLTFGLSTAFLVGLIGRILPSGTVGEN
ncbi:ion channel [uncultured Litoreibacter sp.]|uniref:ion channel n=1 Tax=uncultured Litoreibacter sp. TaxID=1392394 RepID=UPI002602B36B|nr:ion channel [uncultured Litoreibacter sp.]